ncbi:MAG TPA: hypothetical protein VGG34_02005 [Opitutaceae bacterium]|jgi:hypothetical protein
MSYSDSNSGGLAAPGAAPKVVIEALLHRGELLSLELAEARSQGMRVVALVVFCGAFMLLAGFAATIALAAEVWRNPDRGMILGLAALACLVVSAALGYAAARRLGAWQPFAESVRQFHADCLCLRDTLSAATR